MDLYRSIYYAPLIYLMSLCTISGATQVSIERYIPSRDMVAISKILDQNHEMLTYEAMGLPEGTTLKYMNSNNYITDVIRVDDTTVGFVNYCALNINFLTFHVGRRGLIHLIGVDNAYQRQGYGSQLLDHALAEFKKLNVPIVHISVQSNNANALNLYEKKGFKRAYTLPGIEEQNVPLSLFYEIDIPAENLPQGNIIQRHPRITLGCIAVAVGVCVYRRFFAGHP